MMMDDQAPTVPGNLDDTSTRLAAKQWTVERTVVLEGLVVQARVGMLPAEFLVVQPVRIDVEMCLGQGPVLPPGDSIDAVMDYRNARQLIIDLCTRTHTQLVETLAGRITAGLMQLPDVQKVRLKLVKLQAFDDCDAGVTISAARLATPQTAIQ